MFCFPASGVLFQDWMLLFLGLHQELAAAAPHHRLAVGSSGAPESQKGRHQDFVASLGQRRLGLDFLSRLKIIPWLSRSKSRAACAGAELRAPALGCTPAAAVLESREGAPVGGVMVGTRH